MSAGKRRWGRQPRNQVRTTSSSAPPPPPQRKDEDDEEDVCFICFDGGSLVLYDRRNFLRAKHTQIKKVSSSSSCWHLSQDITSTTFYRILSARRYILVDSYRQILGKSISMLNLVFSLRLAEDIQDAYAEAASIAEQLHYLTPKPIFYGFFKEEKC